MDAYRIGSTVQIHSPAKVNLFLEVLGKRPDGFHEIQTLMIAVAIFDSLIVTPNTGGKIRLTCGWASGLEARRGDGLLAPLPSESDNLGYKAAELLARRAGISQGVAIRLNKRIPSEAGLGGASSDAAAVLLALNAVWRLGWNREKLASLAAELGSDIPFFLLAPMRGSMVAVCEGRGERIASVDRIPRLHLVVVKPVEGLSTGVVYRGCQIPTQPRSVTPLIRALQEGRLPEVGRNMFNRLEEVAGGLSGQVRRLRQTCNELDLWGHGMSGSGSSYFALCRSAAHARHVAARLRTKDRQVFATSTL